MARRRLPPLPGYIQDRSTRGWFPQGYGSYRNTPKDERISRYEYERTYRRPRERSFFQTGSAGNRYGYETQKLIVSGSFDVDALIDAIIAMVPPGYVIHINALGRKKEESGKNKKTKEELAEEEEDEEYPDEPNNEWDWRTVLTLTLSDELEQARDQIREQIEDHISDAFESNPHLFDVWSQPFGFGLEGFDEESDNG